LIGINAERGGFAIQNDWFCLRGEFVMISRRQLLFVTALAAATLMRVTAYAQQIAQIGTDSPERKSILDVARASIEHRLGVKVIFVVGRMTMYGDWAFAVLHPRDAAGNRIDYRRTLIGKGFDAEQDSDHFGVLVRRKGASWALVEEALLPTDVYWEEWETKYKLPRALFLSE
jgi:hypothetical protein